MSTYRIFLTQEACVSVEVEADDFEAAVDAALDKAPRDVCGQCGGWGRDYSLELDGEWEPSEDYEVDGEWIEASR